jgi:ribonuclease HI
MTDQKINITATIAVSCITNHPKAGGYGVVITETETGRKVHSLCGGQEWTDNARLLILAAIDTLQWFTTAYPEDARGAVSVMTNDQNTVKSATQWINSWKANDWRRSDGAPVKNREHWQMLDSFQAACAVSWQVGIGQKHNRLHSEAHNIAAKALVTAQCAFPDADGVAA